MTRKQYRPQKRLPTSIHRNNTDRNERRLCSQRQKLELDTAPFIAKLSVCGMQQISRRISQYQGGAYNNTHSLSSAAALLAMDHTAELADRRTPCDYYSSAGGPDPGNSDESSHREKKEKLGGIRYEARSCGCSSPDSSAYQP